MPKTHEQRLQDFARMVLTLMEQEPEWGPDLLDDIATTAFDMELAECDHEAQFRAFIPE